VTPDQVEAMTLADKIVVMNKGRVEQAGKPLELYYKPGNLFVAGFIGSPAMNFLPAVVRKGGTLSLSDGQELKATLPSSCKTGDTVTLGFRPEHMTLGGTGKFALTGIIDIIERLGESGFAHVRLPSGQTIVAEVRGDPHTSSGQSAKLTFDADNLHIFDAEGQRLD
jgi:ABC-type sugar transport system ATPase subunit